MIPSRERGFTLLELLLVVFILAALAGAAATVVDQSDAQLRYEQTKSRLETIREAIVGRDGPRGLAGFAADMGRLPANLKELVDGAGLPAYTVAYLGSDTGVAFGWRGPYLPSLPELGSATLTYPDGWGNASKPDAATNFGWNVLFPGATSLTVQSWGRNDQADDPTNPAVEQYDRDYPTGTSTDPLTIPVLVRPEDWLVNLGNWTLAVTLRNSSATDHTPVNPVRLRLAVPNGAGQLQAYESAPIDVGTIAAGAAPQLSFVFPGSDLVPHGVRSLELVDANGNRVGPDKPQLVTLSARGSRPTALPAPWRVQ